MILVPRRTWTAGLSNPSAGKDPAWRYGGTERRPAIPLPVSMLMVHYAGNPDGIAPGNQFLSIDSRTYMRNVFMWAHTTAPGKQGDEYNFVVAGTEGTVYEWAGAQQAAHCSNWNTRSIGVQFGLDVDDTPPRVYETILLELRRWLVGQGVLTRDHEVDQHGEHFGTDCPGAQVKALWSIYDRPLPAEPTPPPLSPVKGVPMVLCEDCPLFSQPSVWHIVGSDAHHVNATSYYEVLVPTGQAPADPASLKRMPWATLSKLSIHYKPAA